MELGHPGLQPQAPLPSRNQPRGGLKEGLRILAAVPIILSGRLDASVPVITWRNPTHGTDFFAQIPSFQFWIKSDRLLEIDLGPGAVQHHRFSKTDHPYKRSATFEVGDVAIHVASRPSEAMIGKTVENIAANLRPIIVSVFNGVQYADFLLTSTELRNRIDIVDAIQFLTASIYQQGHFRAGACHAVLARILERYNAIVRDLEDDPLLIVDF